MMQMKKKTSKEKKSKGEQIQVQKRKEWTSPGLCCFTPMCDYTVLQKYAHIWFKQNHLGSITLDIITRLLDNAAFVCIQVVGRFSKNFSEVRGSRSRGFQLQVELMATVMCAEL